MQTLEPPRRPHLFHVYEYHKMGELGILREDDRVELIEGELIAMPPIGSLHAGKVMRLVSSLTAVVSNRVIVSPQDPVRLGEYSEPQPDLTVLRLRDDFYEK